MRMFLSVLRLAAQDVAMSIATETPTEGKRSALVKLFDPLCFLYFLNVGLFWIILFWNDYFSIFNYFCFLLFFLFQHIIFCVDFGLQEIIKALQLVHNDNLTEAD